MSFTASCVHCLGPIRPPGLWSSAWQCDEDGDTLPFFDAAVPSAGVLDRLRASAAVPIWVPQPLPTGWCVSAIGWAGDERTRRAGDGGGLLRAGSSRRCAPRRRSSPRSRASGLAARLAGLPAGGAFGGRGPGRGEADRRAASDAALGASRRRQRSGGLRG